MTVSSSPACLVPLSALGLDYTAAKGPDVIFSETFLPAVIIAPLAMLARFLDQSHAKVNILFFKGEEKVKRRTC